MLSRGRFAFRLAGVWPAAVVFCLSTCTAAPPRSPIQADPDVVLTIGYPHVTGQDPLHGATHAASLISLEGLTTQNLNGRPVPRLAESWNESPDGLTWTIRLRPSAVFHDGSAVDSEAVKRSLERSLGGNANHFSPSLQDVLSIKTPEPHLLTIRLKQRSGLLMDDLDIPITKRNSNGTIIGTGPYVVRSTSANEIVMEAFPAYYRGISAVNRLVWRLYPTVRTSWAAMMRGEVDFLYEVGPETREFLEPETSVGLYSFLRNYVHGVVFNVQRPMFRDPQIRRALNYAVDRNAIVERAFSGHAAAASGPAWPMHWAYNASAPSYSYDPALAAASLEKVLSAGASGKRRTSLKFVCLIPENFQLWERLALMVQRNLAAIGVEMALEAVPFDIFNQRIAKGDFDAVMIEMISGFSASRPLSFWHSSGLHNFSNYRNHSVDAALEGIRSAAGDAEYRDKFQQFQKATFSDPPAIFLAWSETARAVSRRFEVIKAPGGDIRMTISDWRLVRERARGNN